MAKLIPTLSPQGYLSHLPDKVNAVLMYYYLSDYSQTDTLRGNVIPLPKLVQLYGNNANEVTSQLETTLQDYLLLNFDGALVSVTNETVGDSINLLVSAIVQDDGVSVSVGYSITVSNARVLDIFDINNNGYINQSRAVGA